jgi:hypothetical protein
MKMVLEDHRPPGTGDGRRLFHQHRTTDLSDAGHLLCCREAVDHDIPVRCDNQAERAVSGPDSGERDS